MLNADTSTPNVYANMGTFGDILYRVLTDAAWRMSENLTTEHSVFNVVKGEYPGSLANFDAVLITASAASSYHLKPWIQTLEKYIVGLYRSHKHIKIFGSCFGHHLICQALLKDYGLRVDKSPKGWEIGINNITLTSDFRKAFTASIERNPTTIYGHYSGRLPSPDDVDDDNGDIDISVARSLTGITASASPATVRLQFVHEDQVIMPSTGTSLPKPWILLGSTEHCAVQGVYQPGRVLTLQGHFEFDKFESRHTERIFGADLVSAADKTYDWGSLERDMKDEIDDGYLVAEMVVQFLLEEGGKDGMERFEPQETLPSPRASVEIL